MHYLGSLRLGISVSALIAAAGLVYLRLPTSFLPNEDQGNLVINVQLPPGATQERTRAVMEQVEGFMLNQPEVKSMVGVLGFSFSGQGQNAGLAFVTLKPWDERPGPEHGAEAIAQRATMALYGFRDAFLFAPGSGADAIGDFVPGEDRILLQGLPFATFAEVVAATRQGTNGAIIDFSPTDAVLLAGVQKAALTAGDFVFLP